MNKKKLIILMAVLFIIVGCGGASISSQFPIPQKVENFRELDSADSVTFQTTMSLEEVADFYKTALTEQGLSEKTLLTVREESVHSTVFEGHDSGKSLVIQSVKLPDGKVNVSIRLEQL